MVRHCHACKEEMHRRMGAIIWFLHMHNGMRMHAFTGQYTAERLQPVTILAAVLLQLLRLVGEHLSWSRGGVAACLSP